MAKDGGSFKPEMVARQMIVDGAPVGKVSKTNLLEVLHVLVVWVRGANLRAKAAEEKLREIPNWQSQYHDLQTVRRRLETENKRLKAENQVLQERFDGYQAELDRWRTESQGQFDACNGQLEEKDDQIKLLCEQLNAALELLNCKDVIARAYTELANARAVAGHAELKLVSLGIKVQLPDEGND